MNVNIVSPWSLRFDHILRRCTEQLPWPVTERPQPDALNYFFPYHCFEDVDGPTAVLFSHDAGHHRWPIAAEKTDLRIAWTDLYAEPLSQYGPTRRILPGIDQVAFRPNGRVTEPVIGVVGLVYGDGRKGEDLWHQLVSERGDAWDLRAAGEGWAGGSAHVPYHEMPEFLRSLQVFLCCSRIEGVPYPPLEALACGVKVVIPRGVGLLDELPSIPGIHRFEAGDYGDMVRAIEAALATEANPEQLRASVARYTWDAWIEGHVLAFQEWIGETL
jgi:hypothetical protein